MSDVVMDIRGFFIENEGSAINPVEKSEFLPNRMRIMFSSGGVAGFALGKKAWELFNCLRAATKVSELKAFLDGKVECFLDGGLPENFVKAISGSTIKGSGCMDVGHNLVPSPWIPGHLYCTKCGWTKFIYPQQEGTPL